MNSGIDSIREWHEGEAIIWRFASAMDIITAYGIGDMLKTKLNSVADKIVSESVRFFDDDAKNENALKALLYKLNSKVDPVTGIGQIYIEHNLHFTDVGRKLFLIITESLESSAYRIERLVTFNRNLRGV